MPGDGMSSAMAHQDSYDYGVLELSNAQLAYESSFQPDIAVLTNLSPNHIDWHGSLAAYYQAKAHIFLQQSPTQHLIMPLAARTELRPWLKHHKGIRIMLAPSAREAADYTLLPQETVMWHDKGMVYVRTPLTPPYAWGIFPDTSVSYSQNLLAIAAVWRCLGDAPPRWETLSDQDRPAYRLMPLGSHRGITFYNDSKSTIPAATWAALEQCEQEGPIVLFAGGVSKGVDRIPFFTEIASRTRICICFGQEGDALAAAVRSGGGTAYVATTLEDGFSDYVRAHQRRGDVVLFSPAGASYDLFTGYEQRGARFTHLVNSFIAKID
jgi:UDP-N-acetylmuramoylalanine--D-glutamate ligase